MVGNLAQVTSRLWRRIDSKTLSTPAKFHSFLDKRELSRALQVTTEHVTLLATQMLACSLEVAGMED